MADIIGTIINVKSYLENKECKISVHPQHEAGQEIVLHADREYIIPSFQRELRWNVDNVNTLISDLSRAPVFLGNVILTIKDDHNCEIIDGQQRTTVLILILAWLRKKYRTQIELLSTCNIKNDSFASFQSLVNLEFDKSSVSESEWKALIARENDKFSQLEKVLDIWNSFEKSEILNDRYSASDLVQNIKRSEVNIIASYSNDVTTGIRYFLDVNLKGVRLDTEDIFKAHLFEIDTREETRELWEKVKHSAMLLNVAKDKKDSKRYPLMKILEHFFYCDLYNDPNYAQVKFGEDFSLIETVTLGKHHFYKGSHLIEVIRNRDYMETCLTRTLRAIEITKEIVESSGPNDSFNSLFLSDKKIDSVDKENCHDLLKKILLEKEVIPKILALKYIITYFDGSNHSKAEYKSIYSVFSATVLFSVFANKKESETFYKMVRMPNWITEINKWLYGYISSHEMTRGKMLAAYKYDEDSDDRIMQLRCKSLAAIVNFIRISRSGDVYSLTVHNASDLNQFLTDKEQFSLEHFIIGNQYTLEIQTSKLNFMYEYLPSTKRYRNSLFNYIFIPRSLNNSLGNGLIHQKYNQLSADADKIKCKYSTRYLETAFSDPAFQKYPRQAKMEEFESKEGATDYLNEYFQKDFPEEFLSFATGFLRTVTWE